MASEPSHPEITDSTQADSAPWSEWTRRVIALLTFAVIIIGLSIAGNVFWQVVFATVIALFLFTPVRLLTQRFHGSYNLTVVIVFIVYLMIFGLLVAFLAAPVIDFVVDLSSGLRDLLADAISYLLTYIPGDADELNFIAEPLSEIVKSRPTDFQAILPGILAVIATMAGVVGSIVSIAYNLFFVNLIALMFLLGIPGLYQWLIHTFPYRQRRQYGILLSRFDETWTGYLWSTAIISVIGAVLTILLLLLLGIPNPLGITVVTTIVLLIPFFGPALGSIVCFFAAFLGGSSVLAMEPVLLGLVTALLLFFIRGFIVGNFIYPKVVGKSVDVPAVIVMIALPFFGAVAGILGMFLTPILVGFLRDIAIFVFRKLDGKEPFPDAPEPDFVSQNHLVNDRLTMPKRASPLTERL